MGLFSFFPLYLMNSILNTGHRMFVISMATLTVIGGYSVFKALPEWREAQREKQREFDRLEAEYLAQQKAKAEFRQKKLRETGQLPTPEELAQFSLKPPKKSF